MTHSLSESLAGGSPLQWAHDFLVAANLPTTEENLRAVVSWEIAESGGGGGMWNPLNTTQGGYAGETNANSVGVKNYVQRSDGIAANAKVIHNGYYPHVVAAFQAGNSAQAVVNAIIVSPWGTRAINLVPPVGPVPSDPTTPPEDDMAMPQIIVCPTGGYWECHKDGAIFAFGGAKFYGRANGSEPGSPKTTERIVSMASTPTGKGYYQLGEHGWLGTFGDAKFAGTQPA